MSEPKEVEGVVDVALGDIAIVGMDVTVASRCYLSGIHLWSSVDAAERCLLAEIDLIGQTHTDMRHRSLAIAAVLNAVAFLEALANEVFQDAADKDAGEYDSPRIAPLAPSAVHAMAELWRSSKQGEKYVGVLEKLQLALILSGQPRLEQGANPYQNGHYLVSLRNDLVHSRPVTRVHGVVDAKHAGGLAARFDWSQLVDRDSPQPWYPDKCLGAGCAGWAAKTARDLAEEWSSRLGLHPYYLGDLPS